MTRVARALVVVCLLGMPGVVAQQVAFRGELRDVGGPADQFTICLTNLDRSAHRESAFVSGNGSFQFRSVVAGTYQLEVVAQNGAVVKQQVVSIAGAANEATISMGSPSKVHALATAGGGTVSVNRLRRDPNGRAVLEYTLGEQYLIKKDLANAHKHLEKAVKVDPEYAEAHLELGTTAFRLGQMDEAKRQFAWAARLDPKQAIAWGNLASLLFPAKAYDEAESAAHHGLDASPNDLKLHFLAGAAEFAKGQVNSEVTEHLERASKGYPNAHLLLAEVLMRSGQAKDVVRHLRASLVSPNEQVRTRAQYLIGEVEKLDLRP